MAERRIFVQTYQLDLTCDRCGGHMEHTGSRFNASFLGASAGTVQHEHKCAQCGTVAWAEREYPMIVHEPVDGLT